MSEIPEDITEAVSQRTTLTDIPCLTMLVTADQAKQILHLREKANVLRREPDRVFGREVR